MKASLHPEEERRLAALRAYGILDTPRESDFDDVAKLAACICEAPISSITLVDHNRQWYKTEIGIGLTETPLDYSLCAHAILQDDMTIVPDTLEDPRFSDNPVCMGNPHIRFYASAKLRTKDGLPIGTLCVLDTKPRRINAQQMQALKVLANQVMAQIELRKSLASAVAHAHDVEEGEKRLALALKIGNIGTYDWVPGSPDIHWDGRVREFWGVGADEPVSYDQFMAGIHPEDRAVAQTAIDRSLEPAGDGTANATYRVIGRNDGILRWVKVTAQTFFERGRPTLRIGTAIDVTDQKHAEERQRLTLAISQIILEEQDPGAPLIGRIHAQAGAHLNAEMCLCYRYDRGAQMLRLVQAIAFPASARTTIETVAPEHSMCWPVVSTGLPFSAGEGEIAADPKAGLLLDMKASAYMCNPLLGADGGLLGTLAFASTRRRSFDAADVDWLQTICHYLSLAWERADALLAVRTSEERFRRAQQAAGVGTWDWDVTANRAVWTEEAWALFEPGGTGEVTFERWRAAVHPDDREAAAQVVSTAIGTGNPYEDEYRVSHNDGTVRWILSRGRVERDSAGRTHMRGTVQDISDKKAIVQELRRSEQFLSAVTDAAPISIYVLDVPTQTNEFVSRHASKFVGYEEAEFKRIIAKPFGLMHSDDAARLPAHLRNVGANQNGEPLEFEYRMRHADGSWRWFLSRDVAFGRDSRGGLTKVLGTAIDITAHKAADEHKRLLMGEVNHRAKNLLAIVQSIARQTAKTASPTEFAEQLSQRLHGISASQDLIISGNWRGVPVAQLVRSQLAYLGENFDRRINLDGEHIVLTPSAAQGIGMALHELATNALKYGSLSTAAGEVDVEWEAMDGDDGQTLRLRWSERGGPVVAKPVRRGFGHTVIERMAALATNGSVSLDYHRHGLVWELRAPEQNVLLGAA